MKRPVITFISFGEKWAIGIRNVSAFLREQGWASNIVIFKTGYSEKHVPTAHEIDLLSDLIRNLKTDIVAFAVFSPFFLRAKMLTEKLKRDLDIIVLWGGYHPTLQPSQCIDIADVVCIGEGEAPIAELMERVASGQAITDIKNLWVKTGDHIDRNSLRPLLQSQDLNTLPFPDIGENNCYVIENNTLIARDPATGAMEYHTLASRGCPFRCSCCFNSRLPEIYSGLGPRIRVKSPTYVVSEIRHALGRCPSAKRVVFHEMFTMNADWVEKFCAEYSQKVRLPFLISSHPDAVSAKAIQMLKEAGLMTVALGIQSPCARVRKEILDRSDTNQRIIDCVEILHANKVEAWFDMILDNPFESDVDKQEGLDFLLTIPKPFTVLPTSLAFFPGHRLTERALSEGIIAPSDVVNTTLLGWFKRKYDWKAGRSTRDAFWNCVYMVASMSIVPAAVVRHMRRINITERSRKRLELFTRMLFIPEYSVLLIKRVLRGQTDPLSLMRVFGAQFIRRVIKKASRSGRAASGSGS